MILIEVLWKGPPVSDSASLHLKVTPRFATCFRTNGRWREDPGLCRWEEPRWDWSRISTRQARALIAQAVFSEYHFDSSLQHSSSHSSKYPHVQRTQTQFFDFIPQWLFGKICLTQARKWRQNAYQAWQSLHKQNHLLSRLDRGQAYSYLPRCLLATTLQSGHSAFWLAAWRLG